MSDTPLTRLQSLDHLLAASLAASQGGLSWRRLGVLGPNPESSQLTARLTAIREAAARTAAGGDAASAPAMIAQLRLAVALAAVPAGERRRFDRWPLAASGLLDLGGRFVAVQTLDIGRGGVMLAPVAGLVAGEALPGLLDLAPIGAAAACSLAVDRDGVIHVAFAPSAAKHADAVARLARRCAAFYEVAFWEATALANDVEALLAAAVPTETIPLDEAFPRDGVRSPRLGRVERGLAGLLRQLPPEPPLAYACVTARDGYVLAERIDADATRSRLHARPADAVTIRAAGFAARPIAQTYRRRSGQEPEQVFSDVSATIRLRGRRWGCVQIGRRLAKPDEI